MSKQRLWIVRIVHEAYVLAPTSDEAKSASDEIKRWDQFPAITAELWDDQALDGWDDSCCVYGPPKDTTLRAAKKIDAESQE
jgi:hypothetical protein